ncbi:MAPK protein hog1 [Aspergillus melleus]|uniref:MAPK protein hog1 n=1 Tax=Aspergillus melleus TaxID=138277 RepID=UPI001E8CC7F0|nr:MAPK protein hog1 [Aspergillus melleus]KAH8431687.1 MAPK protein hog1 [Aspergillus melleus]
MLEQRPLFFGKEPIDQVSVIIELLGTPPDYLNLALRSEDTSRFVESLPRRERQPLATKFRTAGSDAVSLLESMLVFDPKKRICAKEALSHPYLQPYHDPTDEPETEKLCELSDHIELPTDIWKIMMYGKETLSTLSLLSSTPGLSTDDSHTVIRKSSTSTSSDQFI